MGGLERAAPSPAGFPRLQGGAGASEKGRGPHLVLALRPLSWAGIWKKVWGSLDAFPQVP
jgi:hypothetical protein